MMKSIRPYVTFNYDLRSGMAGQSKAKIKRYHKALSRKTRPPHIVYRPRRKDHLKIAMNKAGFTPEISQIKAVPILTTEDRPARWIDKKGRFILQEKYVKTVFVAADAMAIIKDPTAYARKIIRENPNIETFNIRVGDSYLPTVFTKRTFTAGFNRLLSRYKGQRKKDFISNVLTGFDLIDTTGQSTYQEWRAIQKRTPKKAGRKPKKRKKIKGYGSHR